MEAKIKEKRWEPGKEQELFEKWQKDGLYKFDKDCKKKLFSIDTPPPYVNTPIHMGHAFTYTIMDIMARFKRMTGFNVLFPLGLDKNGLPIEVQAEKVFKISMHDTPREEFIQKCKQIIEQAGDASLDSFKRLGLSCNSWKNEHDLGSKYDTDNPEFRRLTQETFIEFWKKGLVYEDLKPANYCPVCRTTISDAEVEYKEEKTDLNYIKFKVKETGKEILIATTRPELLCTCKIVIFNPEDERYKTLAGKTAIVPIFDQEVDIMAHPYADPKFGSGMVMVCSFGDYGDVRLLRELDINPTYAIDDKWKMTETAGKYKGLFVKDARKAVIEDLKKAGLLEKQEKIDQRQPICWRSKNPIEFVPMKELYLKQLDSKDDLLDVAKKTEFFADESRQILNDWINALNIDWVLSRRRYYGTEIPLWYCTKCGEAIVPEPGKYYQPWKDKSPVEICPKCGNASFRGETRVFDTWFDSSSSVLYILGYLWDKEFFTENFPATIRPQGKEIIRTWLYFTLLKAWLQFENKPFHQIWINHHVIDEKGTKMSKSLGNIIDPQEVFKKFGAEAFRAWVCFEGDITKGDIRCSFERIEGSAKFLTKLWNIARFISMFPDAEQAELEPADEWILAELSQTIDKVFKSCERYAFNQAINDIRDFAWNLFADHYIEMIKTRAYANDKSALYTLHECLKNILLLLAPINPFITEQIWLELYGKDSIHVQNFPKAKVRSKLTTLTKGLVDFNSKVWNLKKEKGISLKEKIEVNVPAELKPFEKDLKAMHNIG